MATVILIIMLGVLIFIHELGHFLTAKKSGIRVDEFAIGFPPKLWSKTVKGTKYALNLVPFGGYVKIFGETPDDESLDPNNPESFLNKSALTQASVLLGGVIFNVIFAWLLFSIALMAGSPTIVSDDNSGTIAESFVVVTNFFEGSPAEQAGLEFGDQILNIKSIDNETSQEKNLTVDEITIPTLQSSIQNSSGEVVFTINRVDEVKEIVLNPTTGIIDADKLAVGISMERIGKVKLSFFSAIGRAYLMTGEMIRDITIGLVTLIGSAITGNASLDSVAGPVGIVGLIDNASAFGFYYLLSFTAFISINLAVLNVLPFPALDGGRLLILLIETIIRRRIKTSVVNWINAIGFFILIALMLVITVNDVVKLF
jgi:regulator of sigma E protease